MKKKLISLAAGVAAFGLIASPAAADNHEQSIAEIAAGNESFSTLVAALDAAGLVDTFADCAGGPFTVFAPTNEAFAAALAALDLSAEELLGNTDLLTSVLTYHVVSGKVMAEQVVGLTSATTLNGAAITIAVTDGGVVLNGNVNVVTTDIEACNGVIHVIDGVLLPPTGTPEVPETGLPETGAETTAIAMLALGVLAAGGALLFIGRRRVTA